MHNNFDEFLNFRLIGNVSSGFFFLGLQRSVPVLAITRHNEEPEAAAIAAEGHPQDLADSVQGARRARAPGRLLSQPRGLVLAVGLGSCVYLWSACTSQVSPITLIVTNIYVAVPTSPLDKRKTIFFC